MTEKQLTSLVINKVATQSLYDEMKANGQINEDELYLVGGSGNVESVNGQTGIVTLSASDIDALPSNTTYVSAVDGASGSVTTNAIKYTSQTLTDAEKSQARTNIGAGTSSFSGAYTDLSNKPTIPTKTSELTNDSGFLTAHQDISGKQDKGDYVSYTTNSNITAGKKSGTTYTYGQSPMVVSNGIIIGGTAAEAGLVTRGISGVTTPSATGACTVDNLYINYDGDNKYGRAMVLGAGSAGNAITTSTAASTTATNVYGQLYSAVRGDQMVNYVKAVLPTANINANTSARHTHTNKYILDEITGMVTAEKVNNPDNTTDLVQYGAFQVAAQQIISQIPTVPDSLKNPNALTFTGGSTSSYDGSSPVSVAIPVVPVSLKNPKAITFTGASTGTYDGSSELTIDIPQIETNATFFSAHTVALSSAGWQANDSGVYTQTLAIAKVHAETVLIVAPAPEYKSLWMEKEVYCSEQGEGYLTFISNSTIDTTIIANIVLANLSEEQNSSAVTSTLSAASWIDNAQTISVNGVSADSMIIVGPASSSIDLWRDHAIYCSAQGSGTLTFGCQTTPSSDVSINTIIING